MVFRKSTKFLINFPDGFFHRISKLYKKFRALSKLKNNLKKSKKPLWPKLKNYSTIFFLDNVEKNQLHKNFALSWEYLSPFGFFFRTYFPKNQEIVHVRKKKRPKRVKTIKEFHNVFAFLIFTWLFALTLKTLRKM